MIKLRDYDFASAKRRLRARVVRQLGLVYDRDVGIDEYFTQCVRELDRHGKVDSAVAAITNSIVHDLSILPVELGGTVSAVAGGYAALAEHLRSELPMVRALLILRGHPQHPGFEHFVLERPEQPASHPPTPLAAILDRMYDAAPQVWDLAAFEQAMLEGVRQFCGDEDIEPEWTPDMIYPGSHIGRYMRPLAKSTVFDAVGAFDPAFTRRDALVGEWWLIQPVSPRLSHHHLAQKFGLHYAGILPPAHVDAPGRVVLACFPIQEMSDAHRISLLEDSKFIAGFEKVLWSKGQRPLDDPAFDLAKLEGVTEESYGPYRHSSELPPFPSSRDA